MLVIRLSVYCDHEVSLPIVLLLLIIIITIILLRDKMMRDAELIEALDQISRVGGVAVVHAENGDIVAEVILIFQIIIIIVIIIIVIIIITRRQIIMNHYNAMIIICLHYYVAVLHF